MRPSSKRAPSQRPKITLDTTAAQAVSVVDGSVSAVAYDSAALESSLMGQVETALHKEDEARGKARLAGLRRELSKATQELKAMKKQLQSTPQSAGNYPQLKAKAGQLAGKVESLCELEEAAVQRAEERLRERLPGQSAPGFKYAKAMPRSQEAKQALVGREQEEEKRQEMIRLGVITPFQTLADVPKPRAPEPLFDDDLLELVPADDIAGAVPAAPAPAPAPALAATGPPGLPKPVANGAKGSIPLPPGWSRKRSASTGKWYYITSEGKATWALPTTASLTKTAPETAPTPSSAPKRVKREPPTAASAERLPAAAGEEGAAGEDRKFEWPCYHCTFINEAPAWPVCRMCWTNCSADKDAAPPAKAASGKWQPVKRKKKGRQRDSDSDSEQEEKDVVVFDDGDQEAYAARMEVVMETERDWEESHQVCEGFTMPAKLHERLFEYQRTGVRWLCELHKQGKCVQVGDEMGLGKTITTISLLSTLHRSNMLESCLIACPATILSQWVGEFHTWYPFLRVAVLHSSGSGLSSGGTPESLVAALAASKGVIVTTYEGVRTHSELLSEYRWQYVVLDEGHKIRNPDSGVTLAVKQLQTPHRIILSGSPLQNNLKELWSLFDFVYPGLLGTLPVFQTEFAIPIAVGGYTNATEVQLHTAYQCARKLRDLIARYLLRRMKKDVGSELPKKKEQVLFCKLTSYQRHVYQRVLSSKTVSQAMIGDMKPFAAITMMRKACNHPELVALTADQLPDEDMMLTDAFWEQSGKMVVLQQLLTSWKKDGHRALIFTQTRTVLTLIEKLCEMRGYSYMRMDGLTAIKPRQQMVRAFNREDGPFLFLLTNRVGGLGINLIGADRVLLFEPDWNPASDSQAKERAWRIGQTKEVSVYMLVTAGCIEEKIYHRQLFKQFLANKVLKDPTHSRFFKSNDLQDLFVLAPETAQPTETSSIFGPDAMVAPGEDTDGAPSEDAGESSGILGQLLSNHGLHSVLSHDKIMQNDCTVNKTRNLAESEAEMVAERAAAALARSSRMCRESQQQLTWTGTSGAAGAPRQSGGRFGKKTNPRLGLARAGSVASAAPAPKRGADEGFFGAEGPKKKQGLQASSSSELMQAAHQMEHATVDPTASIALEMATSAKQTLLDHGGAAKTQVLVSEFQQRFAGHEKVFRAVLKKVASFAKDDVGEGVWTLKDEYK